MHSSYQNQRKCAYLTLATNVRAEFTIWITCNTKKAAPSTSTPKEMYSTTKNMMKSSIEFSTDKNLLSAPSMILRTSSRSKSKKLKVEAGNLIGKIFD